MTVKIDGKRYQLVAIAQTVILTDRKIAVLFTAWKRQDIENEIEEHFPNVEPDVFFCDRLESLRCWPTYPFANIRARKHVVAYEAARHLLPRQTFPAEGKVERGT